MGKCFKRCAAVGMIFLLVICAAAAQAEEKSSAKAPVIHIPAANAGDLIWRGKGGCEGKVEVASTREEFTTELYSYLVKSHDEEIKYCVPNVSAGSISVTESTKAAMKMVGSGDMQECRIYFDREFGFIYEPRFEKGKNTFEDEIQLDFYGENGQWICNEYVALCIFLNIPPGGQETDQSSGWKLLELEH